MVPVEHRAPASVLHALPGGLVGLLDPIRRRATPAGKRCTHSGAAAPAPRSASAWRSGGTISALQGDGVGPAGGEERVSATGTA